MPLTQQAPAGSGFVLLLLLMCLLAILSAPLLLYAVLCVAGIVFPASCCSYNNSTSDSTDKPTKALQQQSCQGWTPTAWIYRTGAVPGAWIVSLRMAKDACWREECSRHEYDNSVEGKIFNTATAHRLENLRATGQSRRRK